MELGRERFAVGFKRERGRQRALLTQRAPQRLGKGHQLLRAADLRLERRSRFLPRALHAGLGRIPHEEVIQRSGGQRQHNDREQDPEPDPLFALFRRLRRQGLSGHDRHFRRRLRHFGHYGRLGHRRFRFRRVERAAAGGAEAHVIDKRRAAVMTILHNFPFLCFPVRIMVSWFVKEALDKSAKADGERFLGKSRYGKCSCTLCTRKGHAASVRRQSRQRLRNTTNFPNRWIDEKDPASAADDLFRASLLFPSYHETMGLSSKFPVLRINICEFLTQTSLIPAGKAAILTEITGRRYDL